MAGLFTAVGLSTAAGLAGSLASGAMQSSAANKGVKDARNASIWGWNEGKPYYDASQSFMSPYTQLGTDAMWQFQNWLGNKGNINSASNDFWEPPTMRTAADAAGLDYNTIIHQINAGDLKNLTGYTPKEAFAPITRGQLGDFTGLNPKKALSGYSPRDVQDLAGLDLKGLFGSVGSTALKSPKKQTGQAALKPAQKSNFDKLHGLAQQGQLNDTQQKNYLRLLGKMG
jgi:hypothetical protein